MALEKVSEPVEVLAVVVSSFIVKIELYEKYGLSNSEDTKGTARKCRQFDKGKSN